MTERNAQPDQNEPPEDVATLYSWANLHGAKYRDFSASRAQTREKARQRVEQVIEEERLKVRQETEAQRAAEASRAQEEWQKFDPSVLQSPDKPGAQPTSSVQQTQNLNAPNPQPPRLDRLSALYQPTPDFGTREERTPAADPYGSPANRPPSNPISQGPMREETYPPSRIPRSSSGSREDIARPAWLTPERSEPAAPSLPQPPPEDTLQGSRDRLASRWFALQGMSEGSAPPAQIAPPPTATRAPALAVFSLAGGVGKTSLIATLGRALSGRGERVLLVDTAAYGLLPFFFGARDQRPGLLRTFSPPPSSGDAPIQMITLDPDTMGPESPTQESLTVEISKHSRGAGRVIIDLATASGSVARRIMRISPQILVPLLPDMSSVVSVGSIDAFFQNNTGMPANPPLPHYILNQFDTTQPLHLDVREVLREQLGDRLLPFALRHSPAVSEALAEGMTVMDYAPNSAVTDDYASLAAWVKSLSAPATATFRGVRWSER
ncbi:MAG: cellulose synthase operon protein YhjQ/BcsQ [Terracidiphilus sp.]